MHFRIQLVAIGDDGTEHRHEIADLTRAEATIETTGLTLAESKEVLHALQRTIIEQQVTAYLDQQREIPLSSSLHPALEPGMAEPLSDHLQRFARVRRRTVDLLRGLSDEDWGREVFDPGQGELTLLQVCGQVTQHEVGHLSQLRNLIALLPEP